MSGHAIMDGWGRMGLDVDFQIRQVIPVGPAWAWFCCWARWAWFFIAKKSIIVDAIYLYTFLWLKGGENGFISYYLIQHNLR